ncbi:MAG: tetratricopeptide repeat protein [Candidatus Scalindua sp.]
MMQLKPSIWLTCLCALLVPLMLGICYPSLVDGFEYGLGWCPTCGRDMPASHFPHRRYTPQPPPGPSPAELERRRNEEAAELERRRNEEAAEDALRKGDKYSEPYASKEDYDTAINYYKEAMKLDPNNSTYYKNRISGALYYKAGYYLTYGDYDMAIKCYEDALSYTPNYMGGLREYITWAKRIRDTEAKLEKQRKAHEKTQNMLDDLNSEIKKTGKDYYLQENYLKGLKVNDVPAPGKGGSFKDNGSAKSKKPGMYKKAISDTKKWIKKKKNEFILWTKSESFDKAFGWIPWYSKGKDTYEEGKKIHKGLSEKSKALLNKSMEGAREGSKDLVTEGGSYNYDGDKTQKEMQDEVEKQKTDALKKRLKFKR